MARITPDDNLAKAIKHLAPGEPLMLAPGTYRGGAAISDVPNLHIYGDASPLHPVLIKGGTHGLKFSNCPDLTIRNLQISHATHHGLFIVECPRFAVAGIISRANGGSGVLTANASGGSNPSNPSQIAAARLEQITAEDNGQHGIYLSQSGDNIVVASCSLNRNKRCGLQVNANEPDASRDPHSPSHDAVSHNIHITDLDLDQNQFGPLNAAAINLASVRDSLITNIRITNHSGRHGIALWDDGRNSPDFGCHDIFISDIIADFDPHITPEALIYVNPSCSNISADPASRNIRFNPITPDHDRYISIPVLLDESKPAKPSKAAAPDSDANDSELKQVTATAPAPDGESSQRAGETSKAEGVMPPLTLTGVERDSTS